MSTRAKKTAEDEKAEEWAFKWFADRSAYLLGVTRAQLEEAAAEGVIVAKRGSVVAQYLALMESRRK